MGFQISPGVNVTEIDLTTIVPAVSTTEGGIGGVFKWGPVEDRDLISSENELVIRFGKPTDDNYETWMTAANFLAYGTKLWVSRAADSASRNAVATAEASVNSANTALIKNLKYFSEMTLTDANMYYYAKYPGVLGNSLKISVCDSKDAYAKEFNINAFSTGIQFTVGSNIAVIPGKTLAEVTAPGKLELANNDWVAAGNSSIGFQYLQFKEFKLDNANVNLVFHDKYYLSKDVTMTGKVTRYWEYFKYVDLAPGTTTYTANRGGTGDELHLVVVDEKGALFGTPGAVIETWSSLSRATDAKGEQGGTLYWKDVLNKSSRYVWATADRATAPTTTSTASVPATSTRAYSMYFQGGIDTKSESAIPLGDMVRAYDQFKPAEEIDISLIMLGKAVSTHGVKGMGLAKYILENICEYRKDCILLLSPQLEDVVNRPFQEMENVIETRNELPSSSYGVMDSGYKYQYDRYNDVYRWVPLNGDTAGLIVRTDDLRDPWWSPAGFNRGNIKNVTRLAYNPDKADRDLLYKNGVNPVVNFIGQGTILYGDKTLLSKPSAFDRINVRRLFIVLEKAISTAAKYTLFEFNDSFTRAQFRNLVEPYLRDVQGRRGIYDFRVVCDETNNTGEVIDRNEFVGDIYIKPARSINFIQLNFIAVRTGVQFEEVVGQF
jgi:hypothetical protein